MAFDWTDYNKLANKLIREIQQFEAELLQEAVLRCAISRAYYSAYGVAWKHAVSFLGFTHDEDKSYHKELQEYYNNLKQLYGDDYCGLSENLTQLAGYRVESDYHENKKISHYKCQLVFTLTNTVIDKIKAIEAKNHR